MEFLERVKRAGFPTPALDNRPRLTVWESEVWVAFMALNQTRRTGFAGSEPLEVASVRAWLEVHGWRGEMLVEALDLVLMLDAKWLEWGRRDGPSSQPPNSDRGQPGQAGGARGPARA